MSIVEHHPARQAALQALIQSGLAPLVDAIDREGHYPATFLRQFGALGGFGAGVSTGEGGTGLGLAAQIDHIAQVARSCGATAFLAWCQSVCAWYLSHSDNAQVRERYLSKVARGELLAGTGMSNTVKHLAGIERINLRARREGTGYRISGSLPWVSNLASGHLLIAAAAVEEGGYLLFAVAPDSQALTLRPCPAFAGMEGTGTFSVRLKEAFVPDADVLATPERFEHFMQRIKPGFLLLQIGIGLGIVQASLETISDSNQRLAHVNQFLDDQGSALETEFLALQAMTRALAAQPRQAAPVDILQARARTSELALKATQSAALHAGAAGYLMAHPAQRRLREAMFVAIVTPALKHLRKEIQQLQHEQAA
ncbi:acyl-CoA dehydrogenase family protein [Denitratimonas sp. CY0512]|uniref:acyl-CoA dehydrogenase family protein n=1 Tax=Denitratimonas sp. CY0512 TaxID=3131940 RepID=UPI0030A8B865